MTPGRLWGPQSAAAVPATDDIPAEERPRLQTTVSVPSEAEPAGVILDSAALVQAVTARPMLRANPAEVARQLAWLPYREPQSPRVP